MCREERRCLVLDNTQMLYALHNMLRKGWQPVLNPSMQYAEASHCTMSCMQVGSSQHDLFEQPRIRRKAKSNCTVAEENDQKLAQAKVVVSQAAHLDIIHNDILVPGPSQSAAIMTELKESPLLGSLGGWLSLHTQYHRLRSAHAILACKRCKRKLITQKQEKRMQERRRE